MSTNVVRYSEHIIALLADGKAHYEIEIAALLVPHIPPEKAARIGSRSSATGPSSTPLVLRVQRGIKHITHSALASLRDRGVVAEEEIDGKRAWRLVDEDVLLLARAIQDNAALDDKGVIDP